MKYKIISVILVLTLVFGLIPSYASTTAAGIRPLASAFNTLRQPI